MSKPSPRVERVARLTSKVNPDAALDGVAQVLDQLCRAAARELRARGIAVCLLSAAGPSGIVASSDPTTTTIDELQFTLGEGPGLDAHRSREPVLASNLNDGVALRWPGFARSATEFGVSAVFAFPLVMGSSCLGSLDVYRDRPGHLSAAAVDGGLAFADYVTLVLLMGQRAAGPGEVPDGLDVPLVSRFEIHQAQGMLTIQLGVGLDEALLRMRAYAFAHGRSLGAVAHDIVDRALVLERDQP